MKEAMLALFLLLYSREHAYAQWVPGRIVSAQYPVALVEQERTGTVELRCYIRPDGSVERSDVIAGSADLASIAKDNVDRWAFRRITSGESAFTLLYIFTVNRVSRLGQAPAFKFAFPNRVFVIGEKLVNSEEPVRK